MSNTSYYSFIRIITRPARRSELTPTEPPPPLVIALASEKQWPCARPLCQLLPPSPSLKALVFLLDSLDNCGKARERQTLRAEQDNAQRTQYDTAGARRLTPPRPTRCAGDPSSSGAWRPRPTQPPPHPPPGPPRTRWRDSWPTPRTARRRRSRRRSRRGGGGAGYSRTAPTSSSCCSITATRFDADPPADQARAPLRPPPPTAATARRGACGSWRRWRLPWPAHRPAAASLSMGSWLDSGTLHHMVGKDGVFVP